MARRKRRSKGFEISDTLLATYWALSALLGNAYLLHRDKELKPSTAVMVTATGGALLPIAVAALSIVWIDEHCTLRIKK